MIQPTRTARLDRRDNIERSADAREWRVLINLLATNSLTQFTDPNSGPSPHLFCRAMTLP